LVSKTDVHGYSPWLTKAPSYTPKSGFIIAWLLWESSINQFSNSKSETRQAQNRVNSGILAW